MKHKRLANSQKCLRRITLHLQSMWSNDSEAEKLTITKNNRRINHVFHEFSIVITDTLGLYNAGKVILLGWEGCVVSYCCLVGKTTDMLDIWTEQTVETFQLPNSVSTLKSWPALESRENCSFSVFSKVQQSSKQRQTWPERKAGKQTQTHTHTYVIVSVDCWLSPRHNVL